MVNKFKKGDKVNIIDGSYIIGIQNGEYKEYCNRCNGDRNNLTIVKTGLSVVRPIRGNYTYTLGRNNLDGQFTAVNDLLVTDNKGAFWFTQSRFCVASEPKHTIIIDGKTVILSHKSYLSMRAQLL